MRRVHFSTGLCCWAQRSDDGNSSQPMRQAQAHSPPTGGDQEGAAGAGGSSVGSESLFAPQASGEARADQGVPDPGAASGSTDGWIIPGYAVDRAPGPIKSILKRSHEEPESAGERCARRVRFEQKMTVYRIESRRAVGRPNQARVYSRTYQHMLKSEIRKKQSPAVQANTRKNRDISAVGERLRKQLRFAAPARSCTGQSRQAAARSCAAQRVQTAVSYLS